MAHFEHYYLGSLGRDGFSSLFGDLLERGGPDIVYIIKGSSGNGKSTLLKRAAARVVERGLSVDYIHCSADPDSLDGIAVPARSLVMLDGTAPHTVEPERLWGRHRVLSLYRYLDWDGLLAEGEAAAADSDRYRDLMRRAGRFAAAAASLTQEVFRSARPALLQPKLIASFSRLGRRFFPGQGGRGRLSRRYDTALTPDGLAGWFERNSMGYREVIRIADSSLAAGSLALETLKNTALAAGYDVEASYHPLMPGQLLETVTVREASVLAGLSSFLGRRQAADAKVIYAARFYDQAALRERRSRSALCRRCALELIETAAGLMTEAKAVHDGIERRFASHCDFEQLEADTAKLLDALPL